MPWALVPAHAGAFSALGLALAGETQETSRPVLMPLQALPFSRLQSWMSGLQEQAEAGMEPGSGRRSFKSECLLRFRGQGSGLWLPWCRNLAAAFRRCHESRFGFLPESRAIELVEIRVRASRAARRFPDAIAVPSHFQQQKKRRRRAPVGGAGVTVYRRQELSLDEVVSGPAVIEEFSSTTLIPKRFICKAMRQGLQLQLRG